MKYEPFDVQFELQKIAKNKEKDTLILVIISNIVNYLNKTLSLSSKHASKKKKGYWKTPTYLKKEKEEAI